MLPKFKNYFFPFLSSIQDGGVHSLNEIRGQVASLLKLTIDDLNEKTKGGRNKHEDRIKWSVTYLKGLGLIKSVPNKKGHYHITQKGYLCLKEYGDKLDLNTLRDLEGYKTFAKTNEKKGHWVPGHYRYDGTYIAGYYSSFFAQGIRKIKKNFPVKQQTEENETK